MSISIEARKCRQPTLFGGDVTGFGRRFGPQLFEALFRVDNDPDGDGLRLIAKSQLEYLRELAMLDYGMSQAEFDGVADNIGPYSRDGQGNLFIDTPEGQRTYLGRVNTAALLFDLPIQ